MSDSRSKRGRFIAIGGLLSVAACLAFLAVSRAHHYTAWELIGPAEGSVGIAAGGLPTALRRCWHSSRHFQYYGGNSSCLFSVLPGVLHYYLPWLHWGALTTLALFVAFLVLFLRAVPDGAEIAPLALCGFGSLMTWAVMPAPHIGATFALAAGYWAVFYTRSRSGDLRSLALDLLIWFVIFQLCFHVYEVGRSAAFLPLIGALVLPRVHVRRRVLWILLSACLVYGLYVTNSNSFDFRALLTKINDYRTAAIMTVELPFRALFTERRLEVPAAIVVAVLCVPFLRRARLFWLAALGLQLSALFVLGLSSAAVHDYSVETFRARRFLGASFTSYVVILWAWGDFVGRPALRRLLFAGIVCAAWFSMLHITDFVARRTPDRAMPFLDSSADFFVHREFNDEAEELTSFIRDHPGRHIFFYGWSRYEENITDPAGFPERLLLRLGPAEFLDRVRMIDRAKGCRYTCLPIDSTASVAEEAAPRGDTLYIYVLRNPAKAEVEKQNEAPETLFVLLEERGFTIADEPGGNVFRRYSAKKLPSSGFSQP